MSAHTIVVIGGVTRRIIAEIDHIPNLGETIPTSSYELHTGGRGAFSAVTAYRLSHHKPAEGESAKCIIEDGEFEVRFVGAVGDDDNGNKMKERLRKEFVNVDNMRVLKDEVTSMAFVLVDELSDEKNHRVVFGPGANHALKPSDFDTAEKLIDECGGVKPGVLVVNFELERETVDQIIKTAHAAGDIPMILHLVPADHLLKQRYRGLTHVVIHRAEAKRLFPEKCPPDDGNPRSWNEVAQEFLDRGAENVVITLGSQGAYYSNKSLGENHVSIDKVFDVKNRVGSGETFVGAYAVDYLKQKHLTGKWDIHSAVTRACWAAMLSLEHEGCIYPVRWAGDLDEEIGKIEGGQTENNA